MIQFSANGHETNTLLKPGINHPVTSRHITEEPRHERHCCENIKTCKNTNVFFSADKMGDAYGKNSGKKNECFGGWYENRKKRDHFEYLNLFAKK
jgi:hypothetical protein